MADTIEVPRRIRKLMTPIWNARMGRRLSDVRVCRGMIQSEFAEILSTPHYTVHARQLSYVEQGRRAKLALSWEALEKILGGEELDYILFSENRAKFETRPSYYEWVRMRRGRGGYQSSKPYRVTSSESERRLESNLKEERFRRTMPKRKTRDFNRG